MSDTYEILALKYAENDRPASQNFIGGDPHDRSMPLDYFVWVIRNRARTIVVDTGFNPVSGERRARMIASFNRGYNGFQQTYRTCTPAAGIAIRRYIDEGTKISRDLTARYAN